MTKGYFILVAATILTFEGMPREAGLDFFSLFSCKKLSFLPLNNSFISKEAVLPYFESLLTAVKHSGYRLYLFIDEYDNFANELMIGHHKETPSRYQTLLSGEGIVKTLFKAVKSAAGGRGLERF